ncbi:MAG TPA: glycosyltransferase [Solirubrobacteraceae bacterium]|nr:glycosyltransferase [Solirubrobacteraceae bacterium]
MPARRLLILTYYFPPNPVIGGARWAAMSGWLRRMGHEVTVVTSRVGRPSGVEEDPWVLPTFDVSAVGRVRKLLRRDSAARAEAADSVQKATPRLFTDVMVPDEYLLTWGLLALAKVRRLVSERRIDCVITTGPPHSTHLLPLLLGGRRPAWIVDLRDGWRFEPQRGPWPTRLQERLDALLERRVMNCAEGIIGVTRPIAHDAAGRRGASAEYIPNGWDPDLDVRIEGVRAPPLDHRYVNVVYTGKLSGPLGRDPRPLFAAVRLLAANQPAVASRLRLVFAGRLDVKDERLLRDCGSDEIVKYVGSLSREAALALQRDADVLLLLTARGHTSEATGKLFDYLTAGRPILALASANDASRIVKETGTGITIPVDDVQAIARGLGQAVDGTLAAAYRPHGLDRYLYPGPAEAVAESVERAIARHALRPQARRAGRPSHRGGKGDCPTRGASRGTGEPREAPLEADIETPLRRSGQ